MKRIQVIIDKEGGVAIEGHDFKGSECEEATSFLEKALGMVSKTKKKAERWIQRTTGFASQKLGR